MEKYLAKLESYVKRASEKVAEIRCEDSLVFPIFTDLHTKDADHEFMTRLIPAIKLVTENIKCDAVLDLGDNFDMLGRQIHISNSDRTLGRHGSKRHLKRCCNGICLFGRCRRLCNHG